MFVVKVSLERLQRTWLTNLYVLQLIFGIPQKLKTYTLCSTSGCSDPAQKTVNSYDRAKCTILHVSAESEADVEHKMQAYSTPRT